MTRIELRIVERRIGVGNRWVQCRMKDLHKGDFFRMFESEGAKERIRVGRRSVFKCMSEPYRMPAFVDGEVLNGIWGVETDCERS